MREYRKRFFRTFFRTRKIKMTENQSLSVIFVVSPGFEPRQTVPKTVVLPLHHETINKTILLLSF